jgi:hypothetical protein
MPDRFGLWRADLKGETSEFRVAELTLNRDRSTKMPHGSINYGLTACFCNDFK